jgi:hypothetical protein
MILINMGKTNYTLTVEQMRELDKIANAFIHKIEAELADNIGGILDPYVDRKIDNDKLTAMVWYIGDCISSC